jgi:hydroxypyruvate isomerase
MQGDLLTRLSQHLDYIGHIQISSIPDRQEPDSGEVNYPWLLKQLDLLGYSGYIGAEYCPRADTLGVLQWLTAFRKTN